MTPLSHKEDEQNPSAGPGVLVTARWLAEHLYDPDLRVVEVDVSPAAYDVWHIDGAVLWSIYRDLKDADYRLVDSVALAALFTDAGIGWDSTVVFYGYAPAFGFWLLKLCGHPDVRILDCDRDTWRAEGHQWTTTASILPAGDFHLAELEGRIRADRHVVQGGIGRSGTTIVDVRSDAEYRGERFWPSGTPEPGGRAGHVPSAVLLSLDDLYDERGSFRPASELQAQFSPIDLAGDGELITYCTIGGRAATAWFVLTYLLGRKGVRVYDGSWAEWGRLPESPIDAP